MAKIRTSTEEVKTLNHAHTAAVSAGDEIVVNGQVLVAINDAAADEENVWAYATRKLEVDKEAALAVAVGELVYWVVAAGNVNKTAAGNTKMGMCVEDAAAADAVVTIEHLPNV